MIRSGNFMDLYLPSSATHLTPPRNNRVATEFLLHISFPKWLNSSQNWLFFKCYHLFKIAKNGENWWYFIQYGIPFTKYLKTVKMDDFSYMCYPLFKIAKNSQDWWFFMCYPLYKIARNNQNWWFSILYIFYKIVKYNQK